MSFANKGMVLLVAAGVAVIAAVAAAIVAEPPEQARKRRLDDRRVQDLWQIESVVNEYWKRHQKLPSSLGTLQGTGLQASVADPETNLPYEYLAVSDDSYRICANFALESGNAGRRHGQRRQLNGSHTAGRHCFERTARKKPG